MSSLQALGMLLVAGGVLGCFLVRQLWSRSHEGPAGILGREIRDLLGPAELHFVQLLITVLGSAIGLGSIGLGLSLLYGG